MQITKITQFVFHSLYIYILIRVVKMFHRTKSTIIVSLLAMQTFYQYSLPFGLKERTERKD